MAKHKLEFKHTVVQAYLSGDDGYRFISKQYGVDQATIHKWVSAYREHGLPGLDKKYSRYDARFKLTVLQYMALHRASTRAVAAVFDIRNRGCILEWKQLYDSGGLEALEPRPRGRLMTSPKTPPRASDTQLPSETQMLEALRKENEYLRMENAYLKKLKALIQADKRATPRKKRK